MRWPAALHPAGARSLPRLVRTVLAARRASSPPLPPALHLHGPLAHDALAALLAEVRPLRVTLTDPDAVAHAAKLARVTLVTDGADLDAARAWALVHAGLDTLRLVVAARPDAALRRGLRNVEKLVALRDANRKPGPEIAMTLRFDPGAPDGLVEALAACERLDVAPDVALVPGPAHADALAVLTRARAAAHAARRHATVRAIDDVARRLRGARGACRVPWYEAHVGADGVVHPCGPRVGTGGGVGTAPHRRFAETWDGSAMRAFRATLAGRRDADPVCAACAHDDAALIAGFSARARGGSRGPGSVADRARLARK